MWLVAQQLGFHARANIEAQSPGIHQRPQTAERARNAWRRSLNTVLLDVRGHRRELIGKRMVTALEHQSWELKE